MEKQRKLDETYLMMAQTWSRMSYAIKRKVGCLVVKDGMIISCGVNGTLPKQSNNCEFLEGNPNATREELLEAYKGGKHLLTKDEVIHAEQNSLMKCAKSNISCNGATMYITCCPCIMCSKLIVMAGIRRVVYSEDYRNEDGLNVLKRSNVLVEKIPL